MKRKLLSISFIVAAALLCSTGAKAQTLLYSNDFESGVGTATIVGNGVIEASGDAAHGQVFHNDPAVTNAVRTNYLKLPETIFSDFQTSGSQGLTISFWVNKSNATNYYWSALFGAYGIAPNPTNGKPALTLMTRQTGLVNFDYVNTVNSTNYSYADFSGSGTAATTWIDAAGWHFYAFTITPTTAKVIIDGVEKNSWSFTSTANSNVTGLFNVASELKYIALGGNQAWNWNDPDPAFSFDKLKIYAGALTGAQLSSLMTTDGLAAPVLTASKSALYFDDKFKSDTIVVNGANLGSDITLTAPAGITLGKTSILKTAAADVKVSATWDGTTVVTGNVSLTSGTLSVTMPVKTSVNSYTPAYATGNMIADPTFSAASLAAGGFGGWGPTAITYTKAYSGRGSAYIRGTCWPDGGSIDRTLSDANGNALVANSTYRLRAMVNSKATAGKSFQFQIEGVNGGASIYFQLPNTNGWKQIDTTFTTAATVTAGKGIYFNSCTNAPLITDTCFIDNYELYKIPNVATGLNTINGNKVSTFVRNNKIVSNFTLDNATEVTVSLYNTNGMLIESKKSMGQAGDNERIFNTNLSSGVYLVRTTIYGKFIISKIIL
ncbi:MAG: T9SS type A sorting domain-containing protein [Paludibacter sp.]|nr:T9SS type A sorting domain-containing protein [Paludibacter sp.]